MTWTPATALLAVCLALSLAGVAALLRGRRREPVPSTLLARSAMFEQWPEAVLAVDGAGRLVDVNPAARRCLGLPDGLVLGQPMETVLPTWPELRRRADAERWWPVEAAARPLEARLTPWLASERADPGWLITLREVTRSEPPPGDAGLRQVLDLVPQLIFAKDQAGRYLLVNQALAELYGTTPAALIGRRDTDFAASPAEAERYRRDDQDVLTQGQPKHIPELPVTDARGRVRTLQVLKIPFTFSGTPAPAVLGVATDITDLKQAEAAVRESELRLRRIIDQLPVALAVTRADGACEYINQKHIEVFGYRPDELPSLEVWWRRTCPDPVYQQTVLGAAAAMMAAAIDTQRESGPRVFRLIAKDGLVRDVESHYVHLGERGLWSFNDITPLQRAEATARESERRFRLLAENSLDVIWTMDFAGRFTYVSPSVEQLRGYAPEEVLGQPLEAAVVPGSLAAVMEVLQRGVRELILGERREPALREIEQPRKDGTTVWTEVVARVMYDDAGRPAGILGLSRDITARKALEAENRRLFEAAQRRAIEAETLREAGAVVLATLDRDEMIRRILEQLKRVVPYDSASVQLLRDGQMEIVGGAGFADPEAVLGMRFALEASTPDLLVVQRSRPVRLHDAQVDYPVFREAPHDHIHGWLGVPLEAQGRLIGMLALDSTSAGAFTEAHERLAVAFAGQVAIALENARLFADVQRLAITDALTSVYNRRHFFELAVLEYTRACRYQHPLALIMVDLDHFKSINDQHGHAAGDCVLQAVAQHCCATLRKADLVGRYGGEEFVILLPETTLASAARVAERLRARVARTGIEAGTAQPLYVTLSLGVAELGANECQVEDPDGPLRQLVERADQALYAAKQAGRNRVCVDGSAPQAQA